MNSKSSNSKVEKEKLKKDNTFSTFSLNEIFCTDSHQRYRKIYSFTKQKNIINENEKKNRIIKNNINFMRI